MTSAPAISTYRLELKREYEENGFVVIQKLFDPETVESCLELLKAMDHEDNLEAEQGVRFWRAGELSPFLRRLVADPDLVNILSLALGENIEFLSLKPVCNSTGDSFDISWHQDHSHWFGTNKISVWVALEDATRENGCPCVIPGTQREPFNHGYSGGETHFQNRIDPKLIAHRRIVDVEIKAGSAIVFHDLLVHGSHPNRSGKSRWSLIPTYRRADEIDPSKAWDSSLILSGKSLNKNARALSELAPSS